MPASEPAGRALLALADEHARPGPPSYAQAPALKQRLAGIEGAAADHRARACRPIAPTTRAGVSALHRLLERQHYRLADWRLAVSGINYRRFFDINELAGLRVEDARTFRDMHELVARLIAADQLQGLRLDHIDGLLDPAQYTRRLQQLIRDASAAATVASRSTSWSRKSSADGETMPPFPGVAGTTGYEWLNTISRVLVDQAGREKLDAAVARDRAGAAAISQAVLEAPSSACSTPSWRASSTCWCSCSAASPPAISARATIPRDRLREALAALRPRISALPHLRDGGRLRATTTAPSIERTIAAARAALAGHRRRHLRFPSRRAHARSDRATAGPTAAPRVRNFALKMQQFTGPMAAKSLEDTAFYRYHALLALNEVGGHPTLPALSVAEFHDRMARARRAIRRTA